MNALGLIVAAAIATTGVAATPAAAAPETVRIVEHSRTHYERDDRGWRGDRGNHYGWRNKWHWRTKCWNQWRDGHREKVCRRIRYR